MQIGDRVQIAPHVNCSNAVIGLPGTVMALSWRCPSKVGVKLDGRENPRSHYGVFWFDKCAVTNIESEENYMPTDYLTISVKFLDGSNHGTLYSYALYEGGVASGDIVVVKTGHHGFALAEVVDVEPETASPVQFGRQVVAKVDFTAYNERVQRAKQTAKLKKAMDAKVKELQSTALYELLAEKDPELRSMLEAYKAITGGKPVTSTEEKEDT